jgi:hypothetical protein
MQLNYLLRLWGIEFFEGNDFTFSTFFVNEMNNKSRDKF